MKRPEYLNEWEFFVWRHKTKPNLICHFFSLSLFLVAVVGGLITLNPWWIVPAVVSAPVGTAGHYFFHDGSVRSRDFASPMTVYYLIIIYYLIARGKYASEIARVSQIVKVNGNKNA